MHKFFSFVAASVITLGILFGLGACASTSTASTIQATCNAIVASDAAFQTFAKVHPGVIDANGMNTEGSIIASLGLSVAGTPGNPPPAPGTICAPPYQATTAVTETTLIGAALQVADLLATWQTK
jgi:hypothetical protein